MAGDIEYTPEKLAEAQAIVNAELKRQAEEAAALRAAYWAPVKAVVEGDSWKAVVASIKEIVVTYAADNLLSTHVAALSEIMPRLEAAVASAAPSAIVTPPVIIVTPAPTQTPNQADDTDEA